MLGRLIDVLVRPGAVLARPDQPRLRDGALAVLAAGLLTAATGAALVWQFRRLVPPRELVVATAVTSVVVTLLGVVGWLVVAAVLYGLTSPLSDAGRFRDLLAAVGLGFLPQAASGLVVLGATLLVVTQLSPPADEAAAATFARQLESSSALALAATAGTVRASTTGSLSWVQVVAGVAGALWSGYVWVPAVERVRAVPRARAVAVVAVPVLVMVLNAVNGSGV